MSFLFMGMTNPFHNNSFALSLALKQSLGATLNGPSECHDVILRSDWIINFFVITMSNISCGWITFSNPLTCDKDGPNTKVEGYNLRPQRDRKVCLNFCCQESDRDKFHYIKWLGFSVGWWNESSHRDFYNVTKGTPFSLQGPWASWIVQQTLCVWSLQTRHQFKPLS